MPIDRLNHFTIVTDDVERTAAFFVDALGFERGAAPALDFPVVWLYCGATAVIHIVDRSRPEVSGTGRIDHFGFDASDYAGLKARIEAYGARTMEQTLPAIGLHQIFVESPEGVWIELNFSFEDYRAGIEPCPNDRG
jgi:catechol 2,3-dioxygenase-like lactoylglutathione lyase family enzyme